MYRSLTISLCMLLAACSGKPSSGDTEAAIEQAWEADWLDMGRSVGIVSAQDAGQGANRGIGSLTSQAIDLANSYGGAAAGETAKQIIGKSSSIAKDFGVAGTDSVRFATASKWDVTNFAILESRSSNDEYVVDVRYDIAAIVDGKAEILGREVTQRLRLVRSDGDWVAAPIT